VTHVLPDLDTVLALDRQDRLRDTMRAHGVAALLTSDPINILYACGARNMTVFGMMGPSRFVLVFADGPVVLYEFAGCEHLARHLATVDDVRMAPGITATSGSDAERSRQRFAADIAALCRDQLGDHAELAVERVDFAFTDDLRSNGLALRDATTVFVEARLIKTDTEISAMREAAERVQHCVAVTEASIAAGASEVEIWAAFHHQLIASEGEFVSTRLLQSGANTFPYFREAGPRRVRDGDLVCIDTDAIGYRGYACDLSRTFLCGDGPPSGPQRHLYSLAFEQLHHNAALLGDGVSFAEFAAKSWRVPELHAPYGYVCTAHGLGLCGEHPYVPAAGAAPDGCFRTGMVICVESYIGCDDTYQGVKLEDQFLITDRGATPITDYPFDARLLGESPASGTLGGHEQFD
jgi:Xaa-Pro dipeptidase